MDKLAKHMEQDRFGDFWLTEAIRPSADLPVRPRQGYRLDTYRDRNRGIEVPVLAASVTRQSLFETFLTLLEPLGDSVDVILESSHESGTGRHRDLRRENLDRVILASHLWDFEDLLLNDGCTGLAVLSGSAPIEVQFDEHKLLIVYAADLRPFEAAMAEAGVQRDDGLRLITEGRHFHASDPRHVHAFEQLCFRLGIGETAERISS